MNNLQLTAYTRQKQQPTQAEREALKQRLYSFSNINRIAKIFKRTPQQVGQAFQGMQPSLMNRIAAYIEKRETRLIQNNQN